MSISGVNGMGVNPYAYESSNRTKANIGSFAEAVQNVKKNQSNKKTDSSVWTGDMVITLQEKLCGISYDYSIDNKSKEEMTMDEYKQWFRNEISQMPVSAFVSSTFASSNLIITEEAFERMKSDSEWESTVMNMVRQHFGTNGLIGSKAVGYQIIGASPEECYGEGMPINSGNASNHLWGEEKTWWEKRHERIEMAYQYANKMQKTASSKSFTESLQGIEDIETKKVNIYREYLESRYGSVMIQNVGKDQSSMDTLGAGTFGMNNIVIASNILEEMANDSEKAAYYEEKIQYFLNAVPRYQAELSVMGHEIHSCGIVIHSDGTVTHYITGDLKPEVRAKIEARMKAEDEEKAKRRKMYQERSQKLAKQRREYADVQNYKQALTAELSEYIPDTAINYYIAGPLLPAVSTFTAYESTINTYSNSLIKNVSNAWTHTGEA